MMARTKQIPNPFARKIPLPCRVNPDEMRKIIEKAHRLHEGNISAYVREACLNYKREKKK